MNALEVSRQTVGSLENGRYNPVHYLWHLKYKFDISIEEVFIYERRKYTNKIWYLDIIGLCGLILALTLN